jgi:hypothetical protein
VVATLLVPTAAAADPAGPTDFQTSIVSIDVGGDDPLAVDEEAAVLELFEVQILGGDSFVELAVDPGTEVRVPGYRREPYLWFQADGTVLQNERSPARWLNEDRYSDISLPASVDVDAEPEWVEVAADGTYAWHDHRAHWMNGDKPLGAEPGDTVVDDVVLLQVGEARTEVRVGVRSVLLEPPSPVPALVGGFVALVAALGAAWSWRTGLRQSGGSPVLNPAAFVTVAWAVAAAVVGFGAVAGLPAEAAPGLTAWALPAVGAAGIAAALVIRRQGLVAAPLAAQLVPAALLLAGIELLLWSFLRRAAVTSSLIPTELPMWLDRAVVSGAAVVGLLGLTVGLATLLRRPGRRAPAVASAPTSVAG